MQGKNTLKDVESLTVLENAIKVMLYDKMLQN
jgi:hypothetical protein